jgi:hypothetical protein
MLDFLNSTRRKEAKSSALRGDRTPASESEKTNPLTGELKAKSSTLLPALDYSGIDLPS